MNLKQIRPGSASAEQPLEAAWGFFLVVFTLTGLQVVGAVEEAFMQSSATATGEREWSETYISRRGLKNVEIAAILREVIEQGRLH